MIVSWQRKDEVQPHEGIFAKSIDEVIEYTAQILREEKGELCIIIFVNFEALAKVSFYEELFGTGVGLDSISVPFCGGLTTVIKNKVKELLDE